MLQPTCHLKTMYYTVFYLFHLFSADHSHSSCAPVRRATKLSEFSLITPRGFSMLWRSYATSLIWIAYWSVNIHSLRKTSIQIHGLSCAFLFEGPTSFCPQSYHSSGFANRRRQCDCTQTHIGMPAETSFVLGNYLG